MRTLFIALLCCFCAQLAMSQMIRRGGTFLQNTSGVPITQGAETKLVDGTPYLFNDWSKASIVTMEGQKSDEEIKLNLLEGKLHYKDVNGMEMVAVTPIKEVVLTGSSGKPMKFIHSSSLKFNELGSVWLEELNDGPVRMYKQIKKDVKETKGYGSATTELSVTDEKKYYLLLNNTLFKIKKLGDITDLLSGKWYNDLTRYIKENSLKAREEKDMARLVDYYNTLAKK